MVVPAESPSTEPAVAPTAATAEGAPDQVPPGVLLVSVTDWPTQTVVLPPIAAGAAFTVTGNTLVQPLLIVYEIFAVPRVTGTTTPEVNITPATAPLLLLHVPPAGELLSVEELPVQIDAEPAIALGDAFTENNIVAAQPVGNA
jgi:hypothetical protein